MNSALKKTSAVPQSFLDILELAKARLTLLVLLTTLAGYYLAVPENNLDGWRLFHTLLGTGLVAAAAAALNQWAERSTDALMQRTQNRPLPAGRTHPQAVLVAFGAMAIAGILYLALVVNPLSAFLAALTLAVYLVVYNPLKSRTPHNTLVGAIPGALPPMIGWAAAQGKLDPGAWALFAIVFLWQMPHFFAIAWLYKEDYRAAGLQMVSVNDPHGKATGRQSLFYSLALIPVSLLPDKLGMTGNIYVLGATLLSVGLAATAWHFARQPDPSRARILFFASITYLPLLLGLMAMDKSSF